MNSWRLNEDDLVSLVDLAYDVALDSARWPEFLTAACRVLNAEAALFSSGDAVNEEAAVSTNVHFDPSFMPEYNEWYGARHPGNAVILEHGFPQWAFSPDDWFARAEYERTEFVADFLDRHDLRYQLGLFVASAGTREIALVLFRSRDRGGFTDERTGLNLLKRHVGGAIDVAAALGPIDLAHQALQDTVERLAVGVMLLAADGRICFMNRHARRLVETGDGLAIHDGSPHASSVRETTQLRVLIGASSDPP